MVIPVDVQALPYLLNICDLSPTELNLQRLDNDLWHRRVVLEMVTLLVNLSDRKALIRNRKGKKIQAVIICCLRIVNIRFAIKTTQNFRKEIIPIWVNGKHFVRRMWGGF